MTIVVREIDASGGVPAYTAQQFRQATAALVQNGTSRPLGAVSGKSPGAGLTVSATSTTWTTQPGAAVIDAAITTTQGVYLVSADTTTTGPMTAAHATLNRYDLIYMQVNDTAIDSSGLRSATISYVTGNPASTPTAPSTPARSVALAFILVPFSGGGSPVVTQYPFYAVAAGGVMPVGSDTYRDLRITTPYDGMAVYRQDVNWVEIWNGTQWDVQGHPLLGTASRTAVSGLYSTETPLSVNVSFTLAAARRVIFHYEADVAGSLSTADCRVTLRRNNTGAIIAASDTRIQIGRVQGFGSISRSGSELLSAGTYDYGLLIGTSGGGTASLNASSENPTILEVWDGGSS